MDTHQKGNEEVATLCLQSRVANSVGAVTQRGEEEGQKDAQR